MFKKLPRDACRLPARGRVRARGGCRNRACDEGAADQGRFPCQTVRFASGSCHGFD